MAEAHRFTAMLEAARAGGSFVLVPRPIAAALGGLKQMRVDGTLNGVPYQSSTMAYGGRGLFIGVHKATREATGIEMGDLVEVVVQRDERPRVIEMPAELEAALAAEPGLRARFEGIAFTHRKEMAVSIAEGKRPETRQRRLAAVLDRLRAQ